MVKLEDRDDKNIMLMRKGATQIKLIITQVDLKILSPVVPSLFGERRYRR